jgi:hypothetical protein
MSKTSVRNRLTMTTDENKIELKEEELNRATGGVRKAGGSPVEYLKIKLTDVIIAG